MIITVFLQNKKQRNYDLRDKKQLTEFKKHVTRSINSNKTDLLKEILAQLEPFKKNIQAQEQFRRIQEILKNKPAPVSDDSAVIEQTTACETIEDGETSFQLLYAHLLLDIAKYSGDINHLTWYSTLVINMFMHAATFSPKDGHGKSQAREFGTKSKLQYFRSQGNHPNALLFRNLIKTQQQKGTSRLPFNAGFFKLIGEENFQSKHFCRELKKIDPETGYPKANAGKVSTYVMTQVAHAGARTNNFETLNRGLQKVVTGLTNEAAIQTLLKKLTKIFPPTQKINQLDSQERNRRIRGIFNRFNELYKSNELKQNTEIRLASNLLKYRTDRIKSLKQQARLGALKNINIDDSHCDTTCLMIRLYPSCQKNNDSYKEGVTNVLLSFLGALINHHAQQRGLHLHTERRQSFGFLRPTLTDAGCLMVRLSLGLEPKVFDELVIQSLKEFDIILGKFKFDNETHDSVKKVFEYLPQEKKDGTKRTRKPDTYIRNCVRKDDRTLTTFQQAQIYITEASQKQANGNYLEHAMKNFLEDYVRNGKVLTDSNPGEPQVLNIIQPCSSEIVNLLKNLVEYIVNFVSKLEFLDTDEPLESLGNVYYHSLLKLFNNFNEAQFLLRNLNSMESSEFYRQSTLIIENSLEYLISLDGLRIIRAELQNEPLDPINDLINTELKYTSKSLDISVDRLQLYFSDSGQQAITTALLTLATMLHGQEADSKCHDHDIFLYGKSYFEVAEFLKDRKKDAFSLECPFIEQAKIVFIDISELNKLALKDCTAMKALVIDMTHHPLFDQDILKKTIQAVHERGGWVTIVESALKHEQLGLDKYQTGKIMTLAPPDESLPAEACDLFQKVSDEAVSLSIASYLQMVNEICREKVEIPSAVQALAEVKTEVKLQMKKENEKDKVSTQALLKRGLSVGVPAPKVRPINVEVPSKGIRKIN